MRILVLDDHPLFADALGEFLRVGRPDIEILAAASIEEGVSTLADRGPVDLVLADFNMPGMAGGSGIAQLAAHANGAPVAIVSGEPAHATAAHVRKLGAVGFVSKSLRPPLLRAAILLIAEGGTFFPDAPQGQAPETSAAAQFTDRELAILKAIAVGKSNKQIAAQTQVQEVTIKAHITRILAKTGLSNRVQIALYAVKNGLDS